MFKLLMSENSNGKNEINEKTNTKNVLEGGMSKEPPINIVINGGGTMFFNAYGALKQANLAGIWSHDFIQSYYGTSAGGILAIMLALQYSWDELDDFIIKRPWQNVWKINVMNVFDYYKNRGIYGIEVLQDTFGPLLKGKDLELTVSLKEFYKATGKTIYFYSVKLSTFEIVEFSHHTHPDMEVLTALHASAALPILFKPAEYAGELYTDGGFLLNYPLAKCREEPATILGVRNAYSESSANINEVKNIFEYLSYILNMMVNKSQCETTVKPGYEIVLNTGFIDYSSIWTLAKNPAEREALIKKGADDFSKNA
jgi:predicted acylesterase/phospholipase RssA